MTVRNIKDTIEEWNYGKNFDISEEFNLERKKKMSQKPWTSGDFSGFIQVEKPTKE